MTPKYRIAQRYVLAQCKFWGVCFNHRMVENAMSNTIAHMMQMTELYRKAWK